jgi:hypothetical protein
MSLESATIDVLSRVDAELNYLAPTSSRPRTYTTSSRRRATEHGGE